MYEYNNMKDINHPMYKGSEVFMSKGILTKREKDVFSLLVDNKSTKEIADILNISEKTVRNHISNTMQKVSVKVRAQAGGEVSQLGEISI